jgi:NAD(P)-dependent dehydrogenase (short-subunit alcohol dehydrogenase family)
VMERINVATDYGAFLRAKVVPGVRYEGDYAILPAWSSATAEIAGALQEHAPHLHEYQRFAVTFAVARERAALFKECGLGKCSDGLAWIEHVRGGRPGVICAPLAALHEFENECAKFFPTIPIRFVPAAEVDSWLAAPDGVAMVTHHAFIEDRDLSRVAAFVLDESSILKSGDGVIAQSLVRSVRPVVYRLALSATPAPNDPTEYAAHATFLGYLRSDAEFRAKFFVRDGKEWRIKGHAVEALPRWLARFALWMRDPVAYGMPCAALPRGKPDVSYITLSPSDSGSHDRDLFGAPAGKVTMSTRAAVRGSLYSDRVRIAETVRICRHGQTVVWAMRNPHADAAEAAIRAAGLRVAQISGQTSDEERVRIIRAFLARELDTLVSKVKVVGHGTNLQSAEQMVFAGYDESYESVHQAMRRAHRQGRTGTLAVYFMVSPEEQPIIDTLLAREQRWDADSERQEREFVGALQSDLDAYRTGAAMTIQTEASEHLPDVVGAHHWLRHGDSIAEMQNMEAESVDLSVFSPPFASLFTYSSEAADMGNCSDQDAVEFNIHFSHFARGLHHVMKRGRVVCLHLSQLIAFRSRHGRKGLRDFRGHVINVMEEAGFLYYGEFVVTKNPQATAIRTKSERLQFSQFKRDSLESSPALNDYVLEFRRPGEQAVPVLNDVTNDEWIRWASGVWDDIRETDVLSYQVARAENDERHIAPLQLPVIERCIRLWSNPGEVVFTPFLGIGSEVYTAIRQRRIGWGIELKAEYFQQAVKNADAAEALTYETQDLFHQEDAAQAA